MMARARETAEGFAIGVLCVLVGVCLGLML